MKDFNREVDALEQKMKVLKAELKTAQKFTQSFLEECGRQDIKRVSIGKKTDLIESAKSWGSSGSFGCSGSIFADERKDGWPAIWRVAELTGVGGGCGNSGQYQVKRDAPLMEGVYELKGKVWRKIEG